MWIDAAKLDRQTAHHLLKSCVAPRPIAWISTLGAGGVANAAPYSCFTFVATDPPMICVSFEPKADGSAKDTLANIQRTGQFVVNVPSDDQAEAVNATSQPLPADKSEFTAAGLTAAPCECDEVSAPRIAECAVSLACRLERAITLGRSRHVLVIAEVLAFYVADRLWRDGQVDPAALRPLARLAGDQYARLAAPFTLARPWTRSP